MQQLIQNFKTGSLSVEEVPVPSLSKGMVLVKNDYSLISAGTEKSTVKVAKANIIGKASQRPDLVKQVIQNVRREGLKATVDKVRTKLDSLKALGYSSSGVVLASQDNGNKFKPGDRVACAGQDYASHAEVVSVPHNLVAKIPENVSSEEAAFTTLGAIAMQGVRQCEAGLGERVCVIGLGLLGQITCQLLKANGCFVFGVDLDDKLVELLQETFKITARNRDDANLKTIADYFTDGYGFDSIIITAATNSNDPLELSAELAKKKAKIVVVGSVGMNVPRDPHFYRKELELIMSCSYGPGRYDTTYEEHGNDYPFGYVRWTENRNMQAFLQLISEKSINVKPLISHIFDIKDAIEAYDIVLGKKREDYSAILLKYDQSQFTEASKVKLYNHKPKKINVGLIGAGSFAQSYLIPNMMTYGASLDGVVTTRGITSKNASEKFKFNFCSTDPSDIINNETISTVFIATPHSSHAELTLKALKANKAVFVEKPLAINYEQLSELKNFYPKSTGLLLVGYNRRFATISSFLRKKFEDLREPIIVNIRVNAGFIPKENWLQDPDIGGGRIIGEICHFIDLMQFFTNEEPVKVFAESLKTDNQRTNSNDNLSVIIKFRNGSIGNLTYAANGDRSLSKERIEVFGGENTGIIDDFKGGTYHANGKVQKLKFRGKGHREEVFAFLDAVKKGQASPISFDSLYLTTLTTFKIMDSLSTGLPQDICL